MFRFTIRDVLWLTVVVALVCTHLIPIRDRTKLRKELEETKWLLGHWGDDSRAMRSELERINGPIRGWSGWPDPSDPKKWRYKFIYDERLQDASPAKN
jgi:hypothetical protein